MYDDLRARVKTLETKIAGFNLHFEKDDSYHFVGKTGLFCPMKPGTGGGRLVRKKTEKQLERAKDKEDLYSSVAGAKDYYWMEAEVVKSLAKEKDIDYSYVDKLVDEVKEKINEYVDVNWFISDEEYIPVPF